MAKTKKYKVAEGVALTAKGVIYKEGAVVPDELLNDDNTKTLLAAKKIVEFKGEAESNADDKKAAEAAKAEEEAAKKKAEEEAAKKKAEEEAAKPQGGQQ